MTGFKTAMVAAMAVTMVFAASVAQAQRAPTRAITKIAGDLYRFQNNFHFSVFYVTSEGVVATDPINADAARWLKAEIKKRFNQPITHLVYSHDHPDHVSGGEVFADTAIVIAHENARRAIIGDKRKTAVPQITFKDHMKLELGGKTVEISYVGRNHSDNMIVMRFPAERALFAVDFIPVETVAFRTLGDAYIPEWIDSLRRVEAMDFDILVPGHGKIGKHADVKAFRGYMTDLYDAVLAASRAGLTVEKMKSSIQLPGYAKWAMYGKWLPENIEGMAARIALHRRAR